MGATNETISKVPPLWQQKQAHVWMWISKGLIMCMACNNRICQACGFRFGYHRHSDNACPKREIEGPLTFSQDFIADQFFKKKERKKKDTNAEHAKGNEK